jgi:hypothetical protein
VHLRAFLAAADQARQSAGNPPERSFSMRFEMLALVSAVRAAGVAAAMTLALLPSAQAQTTLTVTNLADSGNGSLRAAILQSAATPSGTIIDFASGLSGTIPLASTLSICNGQTLAIQGASQIAVSGQNNGPVFNTCPGTNVTLSGLTVEDGLVSNQSAPPGESGGGGIQNNGTLTVTNSTFSGNSSIAPSNGGGAIENNGTLTVSNSTFSGNSATADGGSGILNVAVATVINSTFSGNTGTALVNFGQLLVTNSTISGNTGGGIADDTPDGSPGAQLKSTLLAGNTGGNLIGAFISQGYNLSDDGSGVFEFGEGSMTGNMSNTSAGLDPKGLQNNGGPTQTIALLPTSPAVDAIPVASCSGINGNPVTTDQRGVGRPQGKGCDIGGYELIESVPFASFSAQLAIFTLKPYGYELSAALTPGTSSAAFNPTTEAVTLQIASYTVTIPAGSFKQIGKGAGATYTFEGTINGVTTGVVITPLGSNRYGLAAAGAPVNLTAATNPVAVTITIGTSSGTAAVKASRLP